MIRLVVVALIAATGCATVGLPPAALQKLPHRLPATVAPTRYEIEWRIDPSKEKFSGRVEIDLQLGEPTEWVRFHAENLKLTDPHFLGETGRLPARLQPVPSGSEQPVDQWLALPEQPLPAGPITLILDFEGPYDRRLAGLYRASRDGEHHIYTQFEPADARKAFPCLDEPAFKAPFAITVVSPKGLQVHSNAPVAEVQETKDSQRVIFRETPPLPTYLVALVVGKLDVVSTQAGDLPLRGLAARGKGPRLKEALRAHEELLPLLEAYFGIAYPFAKLDLAALTEFAAGAMENAGLITYREELLLTDPRSRSLGAEERIGSVAAHELAHQWFGNLVTMAWWNDLWLNEAFATWMGAKIVDQWRPEFEQGLDLLEGRGKVFHTDSLQAARAVRQPVASVVEAEGAFDGLTYVKGGSILEMIESWIGPEVFRAGVQSYLREQAWKSTTGAVLFTALEQASDEDVGRVARSFLDRPGVPLIETRLRCAEDGGVTVTLSQKRYRALGSAPVIRTPAESDAGAGSTDPWVIPLCLAWPEGERLTRQCLLFDTAETEVTLATATCPPWVHPNAGEHGYFRWQVPADDLSEMATWLEGREGGEIRRMRIALMNQAWGAMAAGALEPGATLSLVESASRSQDARLQRSAAGRVAGAAGLWPDLAETPAFRAFADRVLGPRARKLGWKPKAGELRSQTLMRGKLLWTLGRHGTGEGVVEGAIEQAKLYLEDPKKVSGDVASTALRIARREGAITQDELLAALKKHRGSQVRLSILSGLGSAPEGPELGAALGLVFDDRIRSQDVWYLIGGGFDGEARKAQTFSYLRENYDALQKRLPSFGNRAAGRLSRMVGYFCTTSARDEATAFFVERNAPDHARYLSLGIETADRCIALREAGRSSAQRYFETTLETGLRPAPAPGG